MKIAERPILIVIITGILVLVYFFSREKPPTSLLTPKNSLTMDNQPPAVSVQTEAPEVLIPEEFPLLSAQDPVLVAYVKQRLLQPPAVGDYNLSQPDRKHFSQYTQSRIACRLLEGLEKGFFLEAGALDGEDKSNSLYFERERSWTGLLVEPDPSLYKTLVSKKRKAFSINAAFSLANASDVANFVPHRGLGHLVPKGHKGIPVKTVPIATLLRALDVSQIDYFSIDIEGAELKVLATFPWDKVKIRLMCIEVNHIGIERVNSFMEERGYMYVGKRDIDAWYGWKDLLQETINVEEYPKELAPLCND
ncbi:uncharacterized protein LOC119595721 [Penaeus monodon]|uniref:uncharacterized protein LOC119595721 n=1 Tax=Penaeus monodon TaxID=6687 RepID=UPI0018A6F264|nr:uncharacterized protein LOC119595721 [Penaeus monodon]